MNRIDVCGWCVRVAAFTDHDRTVSCGDDAYGASIRRAIVERTERDVSSGAVYTVLERLERSGLVSSWIGAPTAERGGRRRKHYKIRPDGARSVQLARQRMLKMAAGLDDRLADLAAAEE